MILFDPALGFRRDVVASFSPRPHLRLKHKLQRKLKNSRVRGSVISLDTCIFCYRHDLTEAGSAQIRLEIETPKRIRYVECLGTKFHSLLFADPEGSRESKVELESS